MHTLIHPIYAVLHARTGTPMYACAHAHTQACMHVRRFLDLDIVHCCSQTNTKGGCNVKQARRFRPSQSRVPPKEDSPLQMLKDRQAAEYPKEIENGGGGQFPHDLSMLIIRVALLLVDVTRYACPFPLQLFVNSRVEFRYAPWSALCGHFAPGFTLGSKRRTPRALEPPAGAPAQARRHEVPGGDLLGGRELPHGAREAVVPVMILSLPYIVVHKRVLVTCHGTCVSKFARRLPMEMLH